jgi:hypothetical protein
MDLALLAITAISTAVAIATSAIAWRVVRDERRRSAARAALLASTPLDGELESPVDAGLAARLGPEPDLAGDTGSSAGLFGVIERRSAPAPGLLLGFGAAIVAAVLALAYLSSGSAVAPAQAAAAIRQPAALELLSMRHARSGNTWTITGLVRNPAGAPDAVRLDAVVFTFDRDGSFLASGRAPLDFTTLAPGDESPFVVTVTAPGPVSRYRLSFRADEGQMVPHVDRRQAAASEVQP